MAATESIANPSGKLRQTPAGWRAMVMGKDKGTNQLYLGRTLTLSLSHGCFLSDHNIHAGKPVLLLLSIPPLHAGQEEAIAKIHCRTLCTYLCPERGGFRTSLRFVQFEGIGKEVLHRRINEITHLIPPNVQNRGKTS